MFAGSLTAVKDVLVLDDGSSPLLKCKMQAHLGGTKVKLEDPLELAHLYIWSSRSCSANTIQGLTQQMFALPPKSELDELSTVNP